MLITPKWNVYITDGKSKRTVVYNIFNYTPFNEDCHKLLKTAKNKGKNKIMFAMTLEDILRHHFWEKVDWEIEIVDALGFRHNGLKVDVFDQVMLNFDRFADYLWLYIA